VATGWQKPTAENDRSGGFMIFLNASKAPVLQAYTGIVACVGNA
jgi:hypothetical protein